MISSLLLIAGNRDIDTVETISKSDKKPNIIFILSDDHTTNAISAYGSIYKDIAPTPNIDKIIKFTGIKPSMGIEDMIKEIVAYKK